jgi:phosphohistidine swiveling domain-containing protein
MLVFLPEEASKKAQHSDAKSAAHTSQLTSQLTSLLGGKGHGLWTLSAQKLPVPAWVCVTTTAFEQQLDAWGLGDLNNRLPTPAEAEAVRAHCRNRNATHDLRTALATALAKAGLDSVPLMVRSSARAEDGATSSLAGVFASFAGAHGVDAALESVFDCWASAFSERALSTLTLVGLQEPTAMAVVVQALVPARCSGVVFSRDPSHPHFFRTRRLAAVHGFGETLVQGDVTPASATLDLHSGDENTTPGSQTHGLFWRDGRVVEDTLAGQGVESLPSSAGPLCPSLTKRVWELADRVEKTCNAAVDIEWVLGEDDALFVVQARPLVGMPSLSALNAWGTETSLCLWDNANIVESFSGVVLPLSYSHARVCYEKVYTEFCRFMGVEPERIKDASSVLSSMLGHIRGRVYYNLLNWYRLVHLVPLAGKNSSMMEDMMGVRQSLGNEERAAFDASLRGRVEPAAWRRLAIGFGLVRKLLFPAKHLLAFETRVNKICERELALGCENQASSELLSRYERVRDDILGLWAAPILNDTRCMVAHGLWTKMLGAWIPCRSERSDLESLASHSTSLASLASLLPVVAQDALASDLAFGRIPGATWLSATPAHVAAQDYKQGKTESGELQELHTRVKTYLRDYGYRCPDEQKLEEPDFQEDPTPFFASLQAKMAALQPQPGSKAPREQAQPKEHTDTHVRAQKILSRLPPHKRFLLSRLAQWSASAVGDRERLRLLRGKTFAVPRRLFRALEANWLAAGVLAQQGDLFYLTIDEVRALAHGHLDAASLPSLVDSRRAAYALYSKEEAPPERFVTRGPVAAYASSACALAASRIVAPRPQGQDASALYGQTASAGHVTGIVLVARTYEEASRVDGHILVASRTDPGWVPLFSRCKGLVIERGSALSHSAIMARELGIPTLVGVLDATSRLRDGQNVELDASAGCLRPVLA